MLDITDLSFKYDSEFALNNLSFKVELGQLLGLIGPNGSGKTTLFKTIAGLLKIQGGKISLDGKDLSVLNRKEIAKLVAVVPQVSSPPEGFSVFEIVSLGRFPHLKMFASETLEDIKIVEHTLQEVGLENLAEREVATLSGGEYQRVLVARALAQEPAVMLLDEPVSHLDIKYQIEILELLQNLKKTRMIMGTFHDLNLAGSFCDRLILLSDGKILAEGSSPEVLSIDSISQVYKIEKNKLLHYRNYLLK